MHVHIQRHGSCCVCGSAALRTDILQAVNMYQYISGTALTKGLQQLRSRHVCGAAKQLMCTICGPKRYYAASIGSCGFPAVTYDSKVCVRCYSLSVLSGRFHRVGSARPAGGLGTQPLRNHTCAGLSCKHARQRARTGSWSSGVHAPGGAAADDNACV
jgi:hypothetical protein